VLTAALALVALPGLAGSRAPSAAESVPAGAFLPLSVTALGPATPLAIEGLDDAAMAAGAVDLTTSLIEPGEAPETGPTDRPTVRQPLSSAAPSRKPARYTLTGEATFYDAGSTAMRLPRGTVVIVCGDGGCLELVINDYGPQKPSRIIDLYRPDFFAICGCPSWSGVVDVTVYVY
jgi:hypothetical protein